MRRLQILLGIATISVGLAGCANVPAVTSSDQIKRENSLVIGRAFSDPEPRWIDLGVVPVHFLHVFPGDKRERFTFVGTRAALDASSVLPGIYNFRHFSARGFSFIFDADDQQFSFDVRPGEAVYIGDIVIVHLPGKRFRIEIRDREKEARDLFESKFENSGLVFRKRLMRLEPDTDPWVPH